MRPAARAARLAWIQRLMQHYAWPRRLADEVGWWCWYLDHRGHPDWPAPRGTRRWQRSSSR